jgi:hypothetical protein
MQGEKIRNPVSAHNIMKIPVGVDEPRPLVPPVADNLLRFAAPGSDLSPAVKGISRPGGSVHGECARTRVASVSARGQDDGDM